MAKRLSDSKQYTPATVEKITRYFHRKARPLYVGFVALEIGYSLAQTETMMQVLKDDGVIRPLTGAEKKLLNIRSSDCVWMLVEQPKPAKAGM